MMNQRDIQTLAPTPARPRPSRKALDLVLSEFRTRCQGLDPEGFFNASFELLLEQTGSTDGSMNIIDTAGRVIAATDYPWTTEKEAWYLRHGHTMTYMLAESSLVNYAWDIGPGIAFTYPDSVYQTSPIYRFVYSRLGANYMAVLCSPTQPDGTMHVLALSRPDRGYARRELRALQLIGTEFRERMVGITARYPMPLERFVREPVVIELDRTLHITSLPQHAESVIALHFGFCERMPDGRFKLPGAFERRLRKYWDYAIAQFPPGLHGQEYSFCHTCRGRRLCITFGESAANGLRMSLTEDLSRLKMIAGIRHRCNQMSRDRYSTFAVCMSLLDGISETKALMKHSGIAALKLSSAHKLISKARSLIEQVSNDFE